MEKVFLQLKENQVIELSNGATITPMIAEKLKNLQLGFDDKHPIQNEGIEDIRSMLISIGDILHESNYSGHVSDKELLRALESLWNVRKEIEAFRVD